MTKFVRNIALMTAFAFFVCMPSVANAESFINNPFEMEQNAISVTVSESTLHVKNADHMVLEIFSITGEKIYTTRIDSSSKEIEVENLSRGCYIVRIGKYTRKIYVR